MRHYRLDALQERDGRLYLGGAPFTGVVYEVRGDWVVSNRVVTDGVRGGPEVEWKPGRVRVLPSAIKAVDPEEIDARRPVVGDYLGDELFKGVTYEFDPDTGMLLEELDYDPESGEPGRSWYESGALRAISRQIRTDGAWESTSYFEDGRTQSVTMSLMSWSLTSELRLRTLHLYPGYPEADLNRITFQVDSRLRLCGEGVTDRIVERLDGLQGVAYLNLDNTGITGAGLDRFGDCFGLRELVTYNNRFFRGHDVQSLLPRLLLCKWSRR